MKSFLSKNSVSIVILSVFIGSLQADMLENIKKGSLFAVLTKDQQAKKIDGLNGKVGQARANANAVGASYAQKASLYVTQAESAVKKAVIENPRMATMGVLAALSAVAFGLQRQLQSKKKPARQRASVSRQQDADTWGADQELVEFKDFDAQLQEIVNNAAGIKPVEPSQAKKTVGLDLIFETARNSYEKLKQIQAGEHVSLGGEIMSIFYTPEVQVDVKRLPKQVQRYLYQVCFDYDANGCTYEQSYALAKQLRSEGYVIDEQGYAQKDGHVRCVRSKQQEALRLLTVLRACKRHLVDQQAGQ